MKKDIQNRDDIRLLIDDFYSKVRKDEVIGYLFEEVARVNWEQHLPIMVDFWEDILFQTGGYTGNPMVVHKHLHQKSPLTREHFDQWKKLFLETIDEHFEGPTAALARQRALSIAGLMQVKIDLSQTG